MRRFASHLIYLPDVGSLRQMVVEMEGSIVVQLFPLTEEIADTSWLPGIIILPPSEDEAFHFDLLRQMAASQSVTFPQEQLLAHYNFLAKGRRAAYCAHFNFTLYQPADETPHIQWL